MTQALRHLEQSILTVALSDVTTLLADLTVTQALDTIRQKNIGQRIVYFYVVDAQDRLVGVIPTRELLTAPLAQSISERMIRRVLTIPHTATILEACEAFVLHRLLAFPVVDDERRVVGVVDAGLLSDEAFEMSDGEDRDQIFEYIGFHITQIRDVSPLRAFRYRFPWLLATIGSGTICALLASIYEVTLAQSIVLAFFLTLVLGLGESVSVQSMTVAIQTLHKARPTLQWYLQTLRREISTALLLGVACGTLTGLVVWIWRDAAIEAMSIGMSIVLSLCMACIIGLSIPSLFHAFKLDPKISAGPITLALADIFTLLFYFSLASIILSK